MPRSAGYLQIVQDRLELVLASLIAVAGYVQIAQNVFAIGSEPQQLKRLTQYTMYAVETHYSIGSATSEKNSPTLT